MHTTTKGADQKVAALPSLWDLGLETIHELETDEGILASGKEEIFGCIFGRDSLITALKLLKTYEKNEDPYFLGMARKILSTLARLQGREFNLESGEEPGKIIHEYRTSGYERLTSAPEHPWFLYPDNVLRNYDSVDATPLFLIAAYRYGQLSGDREFLEEIRPATELALEWLHGAQGSHVLGLISYQFSPNRKHGGLTTQSWMDSSESVFHEDGTPTPYPIAPVEVQAYAHLALRLWGYHAEAQMLKDNFRRYFVNDGEIFSIATGIDGVGKPMRSVRSSMGHILWAARTEKLDRITDSILDLKLIPRLVERMLAPDLFVPQAGIRTLSSTSSRFSPVSYHNGSIWPHDNAMIAEGLSNFGYEKEAQAVRGALRGAIEHFKTPIELFVYTDEGFGEYQSASGQKACTKQAWSAASILAEL